jgi:hypothetical protein
MKKILLTISSIKSLSAFKINTQLRGKIVVIGFNEEICGMSCRMSNTRKYALAKR